MFGQCETSQQRFQQRAQGNQALAPMFQPSELLRISQTWSPLKTLCYNGNSLYLFLRDFVLASNTLLSKPPLNSLPVQIHWARCPALWDSTPSNTSEPGRPQNSPWVEGSWEPEEEKQGTLWTQQQKDNPVPNSLSSKGTSAECMEAELCMVKVQTLGRG